MRTARGPAEHPGYRIVEVACLGQDAIVVYARRQKIVLMDSLLSHDDRIDVMEQLMERADVT